MTAKLYLGIGGVVLSVLICIGFLYSGGLQWNNLTSDLTKCLETRIHLQSQVDELKRENARLIQELAKHTASAVTPAAKEICPTCPSPVCPQPICPQPVCPQLQAPACPNCPACPACICNSAPQHEQNSQVAVHSQMTPNLSKLPCWHNTPLYQQGFECSSCAETTPAEWPWKNQADICSYISLGGCCKYRHLLGLDYSFSPQFGWGDLMMLDFAFSAHKELQNIVEFGTYVGVTSLYLGLITRVRGGSVKTFDISDHRHGVVQNAWLPNMEHILTNLLETPPRPEVIKAASQEKTLYFFDNGDKPYECNRFIEYVAKAKKPSNVICTHDWDIEITLESIHSQLDVYGYQPWAFEHAEMLGSHVRCFTKKKGK